ncbi:MAG: hypothetical protein U0575_05735 [Phycisphaerales bacterium]
MTQPTNPQRTARHRILLLVLAALVAAIFLAPRIPQDPAYHDFADKRPLLGIPNCCDVLSNVPFVLVGIWGLVVAWRGAARGADASAREGAMLRSSPFVNRWDRWPYSALFAGALLTAFGSAYYHLAPDNARLVWDRLPMTLGFMGLLTAIISERIGVKAGRALFVPLLLLGAGSVFYWAWGEHRDIGDLRPYALVQFGSLVVLVLILALYPARRSGVGYLVAGLVAYLAAKGLEATDRPVFALGRIVSGHSLKHVAAAVAVACVVLMLRARETER